MSIDTVFAPPLIVVLVYDLANSHWRLYLLWIATTHEYLCLTFDSLCHQPHIVGVNIEELAFFEVDCQARRHSTTIEEEMGEIFGYFW